MAHFENPYCEGECTGDACPCRCHRKEPVLDPDGEMIPEDAGGTQHRARKN